MKLFTSLLIIFCSYSAFAKPVVCEGADYDSDQPFKVVMDTDPSISMSKFAIYESDDNGTTGPLYGQGQLSGTLQPGEYGTGSVTFPDGRKSEFKTVRGQDGFDVAFLFSEIEGKTRNIWFVCFPNWED